MLPGKLRVRVKHMPEFSPVPVGNVLKATWGGGSSANPNTESASGDIVMASGLQEQKRRRSGVWLSKVPVRALPRN